MAGNILDLLASLFGSGQIAQPGMPGQQPGSTPKGPLGTGMAQGAADINKLYPLYQREALDAQANGQPFPSFQDWARSQGLNVVLPR